MKRSNEELNGPDKKRKSNPITCLPEKPRVPLIQFIIARDIVEYIFSFIRNYVPILKFVSKEWYFYFKEIGTQYFF